MPGAPDYVLTGGLARTLDSSNHQAEALAVKDGRVVAVGGAGQILRLAGPTTEVISLKNRLVLPGFTDCHIHLLMYCRKVSMLDLGQAESITDVADSVEGRAHKSGEGKWISGFGWDRNVWPEDQRPDKGILDAVAPDNPVYLWSRDYHTLWVNQRAIDLSGIAGAGIDSATDREHVERGVDSGLFAENAAQLFDDRIPPPSESDQLEAARTGIKELHEMGICSVFSHERLDSLPVLRALEDEGQKLRVFFSLPARKFDESMEVLLDAQRFRGMVQPSWLKVFVDGSLGSRSAEMFDDYSDRPGYRGIPTTDDPKLKDIVSSSKGVALAIHSIGDRATRRAMRALVDHSAAGKIRNRIEHAQLLRREDLDLAYELDAVFSMQPVHLLADAEVAKRAWGDRCRYAFALKSLLAGGALLNFGSDAPVETPDPLLGIWAAVTRRARDTDETWIPEERVGVAEAVRAYTILAARSVGQDDRRGWIGPGCSADLVVLSKDVYEIDPEGIPDITVDLTMVDGTIVHRSL
jgi:hypothetical protein